MEKRALLQDLKQKRSQLIGILGRKGIHIFDATTRTWITSSEKLGYEALFQGEVDFKNGVKRTVVFGK